MKCMFCGHLDSKVIDSRASDDGTIIKRKRECLSCAKRFITIEGVDISPILVIKNNGTRQPFDPNKIRNGVIKACEKRPVSMEKINKLVDELQKKLLSSLEQEITSKKIGEMVMAGLKDIDDVAYVRFASVYRQFKDVSSFLKELENMMTKKQ